MLLIWDIHITSTIKDRICDEIRSYILNRPDEINIIFLWDMVYHFTYDRKSLLQLYSLLIELFELGKNVYVLAGNHDWIAEHYVFEEGQKAFSFASWAWRLQFITEPTFLTIEWQDCLFFPYALLDSTEYSQESSAPYDHLLMSDHQKEQWSWRANSHLQEHISTWRISSTKQSDTLCVFHHRYHVNTSFPWQFATFSYKSPWLSDAFFEMEDIYLISWHLHKPFTYKNYLCVWSVWYTSPLEVNQCKYLFSFSPKDKSLVATWLTLNPYLHIPLEEGESLDRWHVESAWKEVLSDSTSFFSSSHRTVHCETSHKTLSFSDLTVTCICSLSYEEFSALCSPELFESLKDIKIKQKTRPLSHIVELLDTGSKDLWSRVSDWKSLLKEYIHQKYQSSWDVYLNELTDMWIWK